MTEGLVRPAALDPSHWAPRWAPRTWRAAWWARTAVRRTRRALGDQQLGVVVAAPPPLPLDAGRGVQAVLHRSPPSCLERALVLQAWLLALGEEHDVVIGVQRRDGAFAAHAWLDFESGTARAGDFGEIHRLAARRT